MLLKTLHALHFTSNATQVIVNSKPVYLTEHLPDAFLQQKNALMPRFKEARSKKQKAYWRTQNGNYVLYVDDVKITAP